MARRTTAVAAAFADHDAEQLTAAVTDTVRRRGLLPGGSIEDHGGAAVVARFGARFADMGTTDMGSRQARRWPTVTLADGHPAWLIVRHQNVTAALNHAPSAGAAERQAATRLVLHVATGTSTTPMPPHTEL